MNTYQRTHNHFFLSCAYHRNAHGIATLSLKQIEYGEWLSMDEIKDFTIAYMMGGEL
jgi:hypothetical protein